MYLRSVGQSLTTRKSLDHIANRVEDPPTLEQFFGSSDLQPCQKFVLRLLEDAFDCLIGEGHSDNLGGIVLACQRGKMASETETWISSDLEEPLSFLWCCYSLGWEYPKHVRKYMLKYTNHDLITLSQNVKCSIWKIQKKNVTIRDNFRGALEMDGKRIDVGRFSSRKAVTLALHREYQRRGGENARSKCL